MGIRNPNPFIDYDEDIETKEIVEVPKLYKVLMHNDHYTTMDFVVEMLMTYFNKEEQEATKIMMDVHKRGMGVCGTYTFDIAQTKINQVHDSARKRGYPLMCSIEEA